MCTCVSWAYLLLFHRLCLLESLTGEIRKLNMSVAVYRSALYKIDVSIHVFWYKQEHLFDVLSGLYLLPECLVARSKSINTSFHCMEPISRWLHGLYRHECWEIMMSILRSFRNVNSPLGRDLISANSLPVYYSERERLNLYNRLCTEFCVPK